LVKLEQGLFNSIFSALCKLAKHVCFWSQDSLNTMYYHLRFGS